MAGMTDEAKPLDLPALSALERAATPGPWEAREDDSGATGIWQHETSDERLSTRGRAQHVGTANSADAALIVAMRNALPALLAVVAAARARSLRGCSDTCSRALSPEYACDCGHDALRSALAALDGVPRG